MKKKRRRLKGWHLATVASLLTVVGAGLEVCDHVRRDVREAIAMRQTEFDLELRICREARGVWRKGDCIPGR